MGELDEPGPRNSGEHFAPRKVRMTIAHSSQAVTEVSSPLDTGGIPRTEPVMDIPGPRSSEWFTEQNRDFMNYTHTDRENGSSEPFAPKQASYFYFTPAAKPLREYFLALQKWEGYVTEVGSVTFRARLHVLLGEGSDQEAEIYIEEISPADRGLIEPGAVFYWTIGYWIGPRGDCERPRSGFGASQYGPSKKSKPPRKLQPASRFF